MANFTELLFLISLFICLGILFLKVYNVLLLIKFLSKKDYKNKLSYEWYYSLLLFVLFLLFYGILFIVNIISASVLYAILFKLATFLLGLGIMLTIVEILIQQFALKDINSGFYNPKNKNSPNSPKRFI